MNHNNLHQSTNWIAGSPAFVNIPFYLVSLNIPGINFNYPELNKRGMILNAGADSITFGTLSFDMLIDEDFVVYNEFMDIVLKNYNTENGTTEDFVFDFFIDINNNKGNQVLKLEFHNCRLNNIGDITLDSQDSAVNHKMNVEIKFDYFERIFKQTAENLTLI